MKEVRTLYVDAGEDGTRVDRWFKRRWPHLNHIQLNKLFRSGQVRVDGSRVKSDVSGSSISLSCLFLFTRAKQFCLMPRGTVIWMSSSLISQIMGENGTRTRRLVF